MADKEMLILKRSNQEEPIVEIVAFENFFSTLDKVHTSTGHGKRDKMINALKTQFHIPRPFVEHFLTLCEVCQTAGRFPRQGIVVKPIVSSAYLSRGQVDLVNLETCPDGIFKYLMVYQDHLTKFVSLRPLKSKEAKGVAWELFKIFTDKGAPLILQSDNGREFTAQIVKEMMLLFPESKIINGRPRHPQSQGSVERANQDVENMLRAWMNENNTTNWSVGVYIVQQQKNNSFHRTIKRTPFKALYGHDQRVGMHTDNIPLNLLDNIQTEEELSQVLEGNLHLEVVDETEESSIKKESFVWCVARTYKTFA